MFPIEQLGLLCVYILTVSSEQYNTIFFHCTVTPILYLIVNIVASYTYNGQKNNNIRVVNKLLNG